MKSEAWPLRPFCATYIARRADGIQRGRVFPPIPQLYVKGEFVGGCDIIREMFQSGELQFLLKDKGVAAKTTA
jgi:monothiol glutaredoxin